jgi:hypothetical protein
MRPSLYAALFPAMLFVVDCANDAVSPPTDTECIESVSAQITDKRIDSIAVIQNATATVYYEADSMGPYTSVRTTLSVYNIKANNPVTHLPNPTFDDGVVVGDWGSDSIHLWTRMQVDMNVDSVPVSVVVYDTLSVDSLRIFFECLKDSIFCLYDSCYTVPVDSVRSVVTWSYDGDTTTIGLSQARDQYSGIHWTFKWYFDTIVLLSRSIWMV